LVDYLIHVRHPRPGPVLLPPGVTVAAPASPRVLSLSPGSSVAQSFTPTADARDVVLTAPTYAGWTAPGFSTTSQFGVTVAFSRTATAATAPVSARYGPFGLVRSSDVLGAVLLGLDLAVLGTYATRAARRRARVITA
ncbi:MAG: hypothetical protein ACRDV0_02465, partial [Acidimicrobiales bacterium]